MKNIAVILAGGVGSRLGASLPKQFYKVAGKTVIEHTIDTFERNRHIEEIAIVMNPVYIDQMEGIVLHNSWKKVKKILKGGVERYLSTLSAIGAYEDEADEVNLIFHDAVRPLVSQQIIDDVVEALRQYPAVDVAVPATDTIIEVDATGTVITGIPKRSLLRRGQTPQAFRLSLIREAYRRAMQDPAFQSTDDCGTLLQYMPEVPIHVVGGAESNMKLTYKEDTYLMDKLFQLHGVTVRDGDFSQLSGRVVVVFGGNSGIGASLVEMARAAGAQVFSFSRSTTHTDIARADDVKQALEQVTASGCEKIDYIVNAAAVLYKEPLNTMDEAAVDTIIDTNYRGMIHVARAAYRHLAQSKGQLLLYTSSSYTRGRAFYSLYSSTKAAAVNFMQALAQEWEADGIRVNVINPERTKTPMRVKNFGIEPDNTLLTAEAVATASLRTLLSDFTGQVVDVKLNR